MSQITRQQLKTKFRKDPYFILAVIVNNNSCAIRENLLTHGIEVDKDPNQIYDKVLKLYKSNQGNLADQILDVPLIPDNLPKGYLEIMQEMGIARQLKST